MATPFVRSGITYDLEGITGLFPGIFVRGAAHPDIELRIDADVDNLFLTKYVSHVYRASPPLDLTGHDDIRSHFENLPIFDCLVILKQLYTLAGLM